MIIVLCILLALDLATITAFMVLTSNGRWRKYPWLVDVDPEERL